MGGQESAVTRVEIEYVHQRIRDNKKMTVDENRSEVG
jgi:hypothetical protein